jgi:beta-glucosidase
MLNQKLIDFRFMDPLTLGEYPKSMRSLVGARLPKFNTKQAKLLIGSFDFLGINYYSSAYASDAPLLSNVRPSYLTDSLVNPACKKLFFFSYGFSNYLHSLNLKIVDNGICFFIFG